ncbi:chaperonin containing TCP1, subunit 3 [Cyanidioschyzon merolae strain 10D]|uniref:T-complex protein 1 subunit gamma n=1 Tax=Cyanidioschyzon merolae (strain NIES-3377 / 10D) TaxID=280699 RepID=M1VA25_CYAM1|nr:chaperonin containing TCP1, subunit 3 [Cyanidioschyzon merolae strain 10D]BAM78897.1 chaperonin containing TCP1, subunit 3 [Cyanidioschyzon merolae strain 10D]|eukprot:XP_005535183.1 chaperonin containing TCP1, subunit 3 [Cyanidioschyzon merolae strain 10D]
MLKNATPVYVVNTKSQHKRGRDTQLANIAAAKAVADVVRTTLGPRAMLKLILDAIGGVVITSDGNAILREIDVGHPAAKAMLELSRTQDEEVGDGTTSVIVLAGALLQAAEPCLEAGVHPTVIVGAYMRALQDALSELEQRCAIAVDWNDEAQLQRVLRACLGTKVAAVYRERVAAWSLAAVKLIAESSAPAITAGAGTQRPLDIKNLVRVEKIPGGDLDDSAVIRGVVLNKDIVHPQMRRRIENPRLLLLDCPLEYRKGESQLTVEVTREADWEALLQSEEAVVRQLCERIAALRPDLVITEKGISDLAAYLLMRAGISALRRVRKTDNERLVRATGARIVSRIEEASQQDIGTGAGLFEVRRLGEEYYSFIEQCTAPGACTVLLRGGSKDTLNELERNLHDALCVLRSLYGDRRVVAGGGATEMALSRALLQRSALVEGAAQWPYRQAAEALEVIPRTLAENCGTSVVRLLTRLRAEHAEAGHSNIGVDGTSGELIDMIEAGIVDAYAVKAQALKTAVESACMLLRIDDILSAVRKREGSGTATGAADATEDANPTD